MNRFRLAWLASVLLTTAPSANAAGAMPRAEFPLENYRKTVALRVSVNGQQALMPFDTAGGKTVISPDFAKKIGGEPWGRLVGFQMMGNRLETPRCDGIAVSIQGKTFQVPTAAVFDVAPLMAKDAPPVDGLLAMDIFIGHVITIDLVSMKLIVESEASLAERVASMRSLPVSLSREMQGRAIAASLGVQTVRGMVWLELDTGNGGTNLISKAYADLFGLDATVEGPQQGDFEVAPGLRATGNTFTPDMILDGNLGMPFLRGKVTTIDLDKGRLWLSAPEGVRE